MDDGEFLDWFGVEQGLCQAYLLTRLLFKMLFAAVLRVVMGRVSADADVVKDMVSTNKARENKGGREARKAGERVGYPLGDRGGAETHLGSALRRRRGHRFEIEKQPCKDNGSYRCSMPLVRIDSLRSLQGKNVPDDERYGQGHFRY